MSIEGGNSNSASACGSPVRVGGGSSSSDRLENLSLEDSLAMQEVLLRLSEDEVRSLIRTAIRRQVEAEVFIGCSARLNYVLRQSFAAADTELSAKLARIINMPQSFYGIPEAHWSPSDWDVLVRDLRDIRSKTLPLDRMDWLLQVSKEIPRLFQLEHPRADKPLSADDLLPIFIYIVVRAQIGDLLALNQEFQSLCDPDKRLSETGYYLATLEACLQHLVEAEVREGDSVLFSFNLAADDEEEEDEGEEDEEEEAEVQEQGDAPMELGDACVTTNSSSCSTSSVMEQSVQRLTPLDELSVL